MIAAIPSSTLIGVDGRAVVVEVHIASGLPAFHLVGLPDAACREARDRVRAALTSSGVTWATKRITVNLAPSNLKKVGTGLDLAIAVGLLAAAEKITPESIEGMGFLGELRLDGSIRPLDGMVPLVDAVPTSIVVVPEESIGHAKVVGRHRVLGVRSLSHLIAALNGEDAWIEDPPGELQQVSQWGCDLADVRGQPLARWALEVAAAGGHNIMMMGPPGSGKTMLARRMPGLLPDLDRETALITTRIHSAAGLLGPMQGLVKRPPFRAPHHTASRVALVGGGSSVLRPGEASLAHGGVLFLDELCEFASSVLETLREPLEEGVVRIARAAAYCVFPADFLCVAAMNPCPCGEGATPNACRCSVLARARYASRLTGPLQDRFDLRICVQRPKVDQLLSSEAAESTAVVFDRVMAARERAHARGVRCNAQLQGRALEIAAPLGSDAVAFVRQQLQRGRLTARGLDRVKRIALTLADLDGDAPVLRSEHVFAALELRTELNVLEEAS